MDDFRLYSRLSSLLEEKNHTVSSLKKKLDGIGAQINIKTLYRLNKTEPLMRIDAEVACVLCRVLEVTLDQLFTFEAPRPEIIHLEEKSQKRLEKLMQKSNQGSLYPKELNELRQLAAEAERIALKNARTLAAAQKLAS